MEVLAFVLAQGAEGSTDDPSFPWTPTLFYIGGFFLLLWLFVMRPQQQRESQEKEMLGAIKKNDKVVTKSGMYGVVMNVKDNEIVLRVDEQNNVKIKFRRDAIAGVVEAQDKSGNNDKS